jgi:hypothetical protein
VTEELQDDAGCQVYKNVDEYGTCRNNEIRSRMMNLIGCIPIWFTDKPEKCGPLNISRDLAGAVYDILFDIYAESYSSKCKKPCTSVRYQAEHKSTDPEKGGSIVFIFDQTAISSETHLVIDGFTLVNQIGGIIGFCRNIFWFLLFLTGLPKTIEFIMEYFMCLQQKNDSQI